MKALLLTDSKQLEFTDFDAPQVAPDEMLIRVRACGICGSDVHGFDGSTGRRIPPLVMGHEAAGVVEAVGQRVSRFNLGDRVTFDSTIFCGECEYCQRGQVNLCDNRQVMGVSCGDYRRHGAFAELVAVPERVVFALPDQLPFEHAAMIEAVSVAVHAVGRAKPAAGETALVVGSGMIGLLIIQTLRHYGCEQVIAIDVAPERLQLAAQLGATSTINAEETDPLAAIRDSTDGRGVDAAWEAVGAAATVNTAVEAVRKGGSVVLVGNVSPTVPLPLQSVVTRELSLYGSCASSGEYPECIELLASGAIDVSTLITAVAPLEAGPEWFQRLYAREPGLMKVVLQPSL